MDVLQLHPLRVQAELPKRRFEVFGQVAVKGREQNGALIAAVVLQELGPVQSHHRFASTGPAGDLDRSLEGPVGQAALGVVQVDHPVGKIAVIKALQFVGAPELGDVALAVGGIQGGDGSRSRWQVNGTSVHQGDDVCGRFAYQGEGQGFEGEFRQVVAQRCEASRIPQPPHEGN